MKAPASESTPQETQPGSLRTVWEPNVLGKSLDVLFPFARLFAAVPLPAAKVHVADNIPIAVNVVADS